MKDFCEGAAELLSMVAVAVAVVAVVAVVVVVDVVVGVFVGVVVIVLPARYPPAWDDPTNNSFNL